MGCIAWLHRSNRSPSSYNIINCLLAEIRNERTQKGRFREFYQCDIDIIGDGELSIINDAELPSVIYNVFKELGFDNFTIKINNRKLFNGLFESLNQKENAVGILRIIDKIEKIGKDNNLIKETTESFYKN